MSRRPVIIVGGGPTGMSAAAFLANKGVPSLIIERHEGVYEDPRAATFHPPTLEMLDEVGATPELLKRGIVAAKWQTWERSLGLVAEFDLGLLADETRYPYRLQCEQHKLVAILHDLTADRPEIELHAGESVIAIEQQGDHVVVRSDRGVYECEWLIGADGGRSIVRKSQSFEFEGFTYPERFLVITSNYDFEQDGYAFSNYVGDPEEWCAIFKVPADGEPGLWRIVFPTDPEANEEELTSFDSCRQRMERFIPAARPFDITHTNLYTVNQRVADRFREGRVVLIGDAAHLNNPLGGMGMNFGIHDAENVSRALASALASGDTAPVDLFDRQRRTAAHSFLQQMTIANKIALEERDPEVRAARRLELQATAADPARARAHLMRTSMLEGLRQANAIV